MSLTPITNSKEIREAFVVVSTNLKKGTKPFKKQQVGWPGGSGKYTVYWRSKERIWSMLEPRQIENRYRVSFGTEQPPQPKSLSITCEMNPPFRKYNRRIAGAFLKDDVGVIYLAHSGKVGGGRKGIGKSAFQKYWRGENVETVEWPDARKTEMIVIGRIDGARLPSQIAHFVFEVEQFKKAVMEGLWKRTDIRTREKFSPEFAGTRRGYTVTGVIEARCDHGRIIEVLAESLRKRKLDFANDKQRDMYVLARKRKLQILFEVKTDSSTTSIYQGIGQALYHTALYTPQPQPVLVMPGRPNEQTARVLKRLGIELVSYKLNGNKPEFDGLDRVLAG